MFERWTLPVSLLVIAKHFLVPKLGVGLDGPREDRRRLELRLRVHSRAKDRPGKLQLSRIPAKNFLECSLVSNLGLSDLAHSTLFFFLDCSHFLNSYFVPAAASLCFSAGRHEVTDGFFLSSESKRVNGRRKLGKLFSE